MIVLPNDNLVNVSADLTIKMWSSNGTLRKTLHGNGREYLYLALLPNGDFACTTRESMVRIWSQAGDFKQLFPLEASNAYPMCVLHNGDFAMSSEHGEIKIFDRDLAEVKKTLRGHLQALLELKVTPSGELISSSADGTIKFWI